MNLTLDYELTKDDLVIKIGDFETDLGGRHYSVKDSINIPLRDLRHAIEAKRKADMDAGDYDVR